MVGRFLRNRRAHGTIEKGALHRVLQALLYKSNDELNNYESNDKVIILVRPKNCNSVKIILQNLIFCHGGFYAIYQAVVHTAYYVGMTSYSYKYTSDISAG
jgi:hypothetical protein